MRVAVDEVGRDDAGLDAFLRAVDVGEEGVERRDALLQAALERDPFRLGQHARDDVEGDQPLGRLVVAVDREGDADAAEEQLGLAAAGVEDLGGRLVEPLLQVPRRRSGRPPAPLRRPFISSNAARPIAGSACLFAASLDARCVPGKGRGTQETDMLDRYGYATHEVLNQPPPLADYDAYDDGRDHERDRARLRRRLGRNPPARSRPHGRQRACPAPRPAGEPAHAGAQDARPFRQPGRRDRVPPCLARADGARHRPGDAIRLPGPRSVPARRSRAPRSPIFGTRARTGSCARS